MTHFKDALQDPSSHYALPEDVLKDSALTTDQKIQILHQWEYDARELMVADDENMVGESSNKLHRILSALHKLDPNYDSTSYSSGKHGGGKI